MSFLNHLKSQASALQSRPSQARLSVDGMTPWPVMKLIDFRVDSRKKMLRASV